MLHIFNRAKLLVTSDLDRLSRVRELLLEADIDCLYRIQTMRNPSFFSERRRAETDHSGIRGKQIEYKLYVRKDELDRAKTFL